jgi:site-specific DNA recombinase
MGSKQARVYPPGDKAMNSGNTNHRVAIYSRVSTLEQSMEGVSIEAQLATLHSYAKAQGWEVAGEYVDAGYSGGTDNRPNLKRLLMDAGKHQFSIIAVAKLDRFFRNLRLMLDILHSLEQMGIKFVATQEMLDTSTPYGRFAIQIMGVIAEFERGRIGERVRDSRQYRIAQGQWPGGHTLYGYRWLHKEQRWEVILEEAKVIRHIYDLYLNKKIGILPIALQLNKEGYHPRSGALWRFGTVHEVLTHPGYKGQHYLGLPMPVIIDEDTWRQAQQRRVNARRVRSNIRGWLLQGMCICGQCGHVLQCVQKRGEKARYYVCRGRLARNHLDGGARCTMRWIRADRLEWAVWNKVKAVLNDPNTLAQCVTKALSDLEERRAQMGTQVLSMDREIEALRTKKERLGIAFADGTIKEETYKLKLRQLKKQEADSLKCRDNIDPSTLTELSVLEDRIAAARNILSKGQLLLSEFGIFGMTGDKYLPAGFNVLRETDGQLAIGGAIQQDVFHIEGTEKVIRGIDVPAGFWEIHNSEEQSEKIKRNMRAILQLFNIRVYVLPDKVEIQGAIPGQVLDKPTQDQLAGASIISSARGSGGWGQCHGETKHDNLCH